MCKYIIYKHLIKIYIYGYNKNKYIKTIYILDKGMHVWL